jgi:malonyl-CoA O-methyltransferase
LQVRSYAGPAGQPLPLVLLHGWGVHGGLWDKWIAQLQRYFHVYSVDLPGYGDNLDCLCDYQLPELLSRLEKVLPPQALYFGWSMGGAVALAFADRYPQRVKGLVCLATNPCFVVREDWPCAMEADKFQLFASGVKNNPALTLKRFLSLIARGADNEREQLVLLRSLYGSRSSASPAELLNSLQLLGELDLRETLKNLAVPVLWIAGAEDSLVPDAVINYLSAASGDNVTTVRIEGAAHAPFISHPHIVLNALLQFCRRRHWLEAFDNHIEKQKIASSFSQAAESYDSVAQLQRHVGNLLLQKIPNNHESGNVVDLGCGTGYFARSLQQRLQPECLLGIDLAGGMLSYAREKNQPTDVVWLGGDAESLPLADESVSVIFSSLAMQWSEHQELVFAEAARVLRRGGVFVFATLGSDTLKEMRQAWREVDNYTHVNHFLHIDTVLQKIAASDLQVLSMEQQALVMEYEQLRDLTRELKGLGARNLNQGRPQGLTGRKRMIKFKAAYEQFRNDSGRLPASYDVIFGVLKKEV